jgi:hypothetical protein
MLMAQWLLGVGDLSDRKCSMDVSTKAHGAEATSSLEIFLSGGARREFRQLRMLLRLPVR